MNLPSDDQLDTLSSAVPSVMGRGLPPSALTKKIWLWPLGLESKEMYLPSGDHRGVPESDFKNVSCCGCAQSRGSHVQISLSPERRDTKATLRPSGENRGALLYVADGRKGFACGWLPATPPAMSMIQRLG